MKPVTLARKIRKFFKDNPDKWIQNTSFQIEKNKRNQKPIPNFKYGRRNIYGCCLMGAAELCASKTSNLLEINPKDEKVYLSFFTDFRNFLSEINEGWLIGVYNDTHEFTEVMECLDDYIKARK